MIQAHTCTASLVVAIVGSGIAADRLTDEQALGDESFAWTLTLAC